ncbi:MAG: hypothetical protein O9301_10560 [Leptospira sp.]|nr:hypothetical protein [Leptospira sp.]
MIFTKKEIEEHFPLEERLRLDRAKSQNSLVYWINELVRAQVRGADDVPTLIQVTKDLIEQVESLYAEKENNATIRDSATSKSGDVDLLKEQLSDLYAEKERLFAKTGTDSVDEVLQMIVGMEEQLNSMYAEYET